MIPQRLRIVLPLLASTSLLTACDFTAGVYRVSTLDTPPVPSCVEQALRRAARVEDVTYATTEVNGQSLHRFTYRAEGVGVRIDVDRDATRPGYRHYYEVFNTVPPEALVARLRPVMRRIDHALEQRCALSGLSREVEEHCPRGPFASAACAP